MRGRRRGYPLPGATELWTEEHSDRSITPPEDVAICNVHVAVGGRDRTLSTRREDRGKPRECEGRQSFYGRPVCIVAHLFAVVERQSLAVDFGVVPARNDMARQSAQLVEIGVWGTPRQGALSGFSIRFRQISMSDGRQILRVQGRAVVGVG